MKFNREKADFHYKQFCGKYKTDKWKKKSIIREEIRAIFTFYDISKKDLVEIKKMILERINETVDS